MPRTVSPPPKLSEVSNTRDSLHPLWSEPSVTNDAEVFTYRKVEEATDGEAEKMVVLELMRFEFRQIKDIDQVRQTFGARVFLQFRIEGAANDEALTKGLSPEDRRDRPEFGSAEWYLSCLKWRNAYETPCVLESAVHKIDKDLHLVLEVEGHFIEDMELEVFPFDQQALSVKLKCACAKEGKVPVAFKGLTSCSQSMDHDALAALRDSYDVEDRMQVELGETKPLPGRTYPILCFTANVHRKPVFYLVNVRAHRSRHTHPPPSHSLSEWRCRRAPAQVAIPMSMLSLMTFLQFEIPYDELSDRASITLTLVLTAVAYKLVTASMLPAISYLTLIDEFISLCILQICVVYLESAFAPRLGEAFDVAAWYGCLGMWVLTHAYFVARAGLQLRLRSKDWHRRDPRHPAHWPVVDALLAMPFVRRLVAGDSRHLVSRAAATLEPLLDGKVRRSDDMQRDRAEEERIRGAAR